MAMKMIPTLFCILSIWVFTNVDSAHHAPAPAVDCSGLVLSMVDCLSFVTSGSTVKKPEGSCCSGLKTVLKSNAECICEAFKNSAQFGVSLNVTKAMALPSACHVSAPSINNCGVTLVTGAAPAPSPMALSPGSVAGAPTAAAGANELAPAPASASSGTSAFAVAFCSLALILVVPSLSLF